VLKAINVFSGALQYCDMYSNSFNRYFLYLHEMRVSTLVLDQVELGIIFSFILISLFTSVTKETDLNAYRVVRLQSYTFPLLDGVLHLNCCCPTYT
jgi:hypothetical protein